LVQTGSVFLQAKPEVYRCRNDIDDLPNATFESANFASTSCRVFDIDWENSCPNTEAPEDYEECSSNNNLVNNDTKCSKCDDYVYSPDNTFTETVTAMSFAYYNLHTITTIMGLAIKTK